MLPEDEAAFPSEILFKIGQEVVETGDAKTQSNLFLTHSLFRLGLTRRGAKIKCSDSKDIHKLFRELTAFKRSFPDLTFADVYLLSTTIPNNVFARNQLQHIVSVTPTLTQINIRMNLLTLFSSNAFSFLKDCAPSLASVKVLRIGYFVNQTELDEFGVKNPWDRPELWTDFVVQLKCLEVVQILSMVLLSPIDATSERKWVLGWATRLPALKAVYMYHGADYTAQIFDEIDGIYLGRRMAYLREKDDEWKATRWRERSWEETMRDAGVDLRRGGPQWWVTLPEEDLDPFDGDSFIAL